MPFWYFDKNELRIVIGALFAQRITNTLVRWHAMQSTRNLFLHNLGKALK